MHILSKTLYVDKDLIRFLLQDHLNKSKSFAASTQELHPLRLCSRVPLVCEMTLSGVLYNKQCWTSGLCNVDDSDLDALSSPFSLSIRSSRSHVSRQMPIKRLAPDWHFQLIEGILCHIIRVQLVQLFHDDINVWLMWLREEEKLGAGERLEAGKAEVGRFEDFNACSLIGWNAQWRRCERFGDCVDTWNDQLEWIWIINII